MRNISQEKLRRLEIPVPSFDAQVAGVELLDSYADTLTALRGSVGSALTRATALRAAVLSAASSGRLVPQNPADEPATQSLASPLSHQTADSKKPPKLDRSTRVPTQATA
jgi:type I restriction enzyme S subunit